MKPNDTNAVRNADDANKVTGKADGKMFFLIEHGCSGSTATMKTAKQILRAHGFDIFKTNKEMYRSDRNKYFEAAKEELVKSGVTKPSKNSILLKSFTLMNEIATKNGQVVMSEVTNEELIQDLKKTKNALFGHMYRQNILDKAICATRDCFPLSKRISSYPVAIKNGTYEQTDLCFSRREHPEIEVKANFSSISKLRKQMHGSIKKSKNFKKWANSYIAPSKSQAYEDLFAFEYTSNETVFESSVRAWDSFLKSMDLDIKIIAKTLRSMQNTRSAPKSHDKLIHNFKELENIFRSSDPQLHEFIRMPEFLHAGDERSRIYSLAVPVGKLAGFITDKRS